MSCHACHCQWSINDCHAIYIRSNKTQFGRTRPVIEAISWSSTPTTPLLTTSNTTHVNFTKTKQTSSFHGMFVGGCVWMFLWIKLVLLLLVLYIKILSIQISVYICYVYVYLHNLKYLKLGSRSCFARVLDPESSSRVKLTRVSLSLLQMFVVSFSLRTAVRSRTLPPLLVLNQKQTRLNTRHKSGAPPLQSYQELVKNGKLSENPAQVNYLRNILIKEKPKINCVILH